MVFDYIRGLLKFMGKELYIWISNLAIFSSKARYLRLATLARQVIILLQMDGTISILHCDESDGDRTYIAPELLNAEYFTSAADIFRLFNT